MTFTFDDRYLAKQATVILGTSYGGEGKTKVSNYLSRCFQFAITTNSGNKEGRKTTYNGKELILSIIPLSILNEDTITILGPDTHIDLKKLVIDLNYIFKCGVPINPNRLKISDQAILELPHPIPLQGYDELQVRIIDIQNGTYEEKIKKACKLLISNNYKNFNYIDFIDTNIRYCGLYRNSMRSLNQYICNVQGYLNTVMQSGNEILVEAPSVYKPTIGNMYPQNSMGTVLPVGVAATYVNRVIGVCTAYSTMVGEGIFPTEVFGMERVIIQHQGNEFEEITKNSDDSAQDDDIIIHGFDPEKGVEKPRRCGWLDLVQLKHCIEANGIGALAMTKLDTIGEVGLIEKEICVCTGYSYKSPRHDVKFDISYVPTDMENVEPIYSQTKFEGWLIQPDTKTFEDLPYEARRYIEFIEKYLEIPITFIGIGRGEDDIICYPH